MFIAVNTIAGPGGNSRVVEAFKQAAPAMKQFQGFLGLELWTAADGSIQAISRWTSKEALDEYLNNALFHRHHGSSAQPEGAQAHSHSHSNEQPQVAYYNAEQIG